MIAKINTGSNLYGALAYNQEKVDEGLGKVLVGNNVKEVGIRLNEISAILTPNNRIVGLLFFINNHGLKVLDITKKV